MWAYNIGKSRALHNSLGYQIALPFPYLGFSVANLQLFKATILILLILMLDIAIVFWHNSFKLNILEELWASKI